MKIQPRAIDGFVKKPPANIVAALVYGPDEGLVRERVRTLIKSALGDANDPFALCEFTAAQLAAEPSKLADEARSISMLGGARAIRVQGGGDSIAKIVEETLKNLKSGSNFIVIDAGELGPRSSLRLLFEKLDNAGAVACYVDDERDVARLLADQLKGAGFRISSDALSHIAANVLGDRGVLRAEAEKIMIYMGEQRDISLEDAEACIGGSATLSLDGLAKLVAGGQFAQAERILQSVLSEGLPAVTALRTLQNYFLRLHVTKGRIAAGESVDAALAKLRPPVFYKHKDAFIAQTSSWSLAQVEQALLVLQSAEARCKQTGSAPEILCGRALMTLAQMGARAMRRRA